MTDLVIDANSLWARSFFAAQSSGFAVSAVMTTLRTVVRLLGEDAKLPGKVERLLFCWDADRKNAKDRAEKPPGYHEGQEEFVEFTVRALGAAHAVVDGYEADDLIATAAMEMERLGRTVVIVSGDKDLEQMQSPSVHYYSLNKKMLLSRREICEKWSVKRPIHVAIALAIQGDPVDDIKGIPRWGKAKVKKLFEEISPEMKFSEVLEVVRKQVPQEHAEAFETCLGLTLLNTRVPDVCDPNPVIYVDPETLKWPANAGHARSEYTALYCKSIGKAPEDYYMRGLEAEGDFEEKER